MLPMLLSYYRTIDDLGDAGTRPSRRSVRVEDRRKLKIAVIDDQSFEATRILRNYQYDIVEVGDLKRIDEIAEFPIVLCDLMGVGMNFDENQQGVVLIREIRRNYPATIISAYSGAAKSSEAVKSAQHFADHFVPKDASKEDWVRRLDSMISDALDPRYVWSRIRRSLVENSINTKSLLKLEDNFVRAIQEKSGRRSQFNEIVEGGNMSEAARAIVNGLISSAIYGLLVGA